MYSFLDTDAWESLEDMYNTASAYLKKGQPDAATGLLREVLRRDPHHAGAHFHLAHALRMSGHPEEALAYLNEALLSLPDEPSLHMALGDVLLDLTHEDAAILEYQRALEITPNYAEAYHRIGMAHHKRGRIEGALTAYHDAIRLQNLCKNLVYVSNLRRV